LFGAGFESFWLGQRLKKLWTIFVWSPNQAHNGYIEVYLNLGWVGLICLLLIMMTGYRKVVKGFRKDRSTASLRLAYFVITVIYNITEAGLRMFNPIWIVFLLSIAIVFKTKRETPRLEKPAPMPRNVESFGFNRPDFEPMPVHHEPGR
jgi:O-antigen ligase